jgi:hypothetical protein
MAVHSHRALLTRYRRVIMAPALASLRPLLLIRAPAQQRAQPAPQRAAAALRSAGFLRGSAQLTAPTPLARRGRRSVVSATASADGAPSGVPARIKEFFGGAKLDKKKLAALGTSALLAYGFVSNVNAVTLLIISWVSFAKSTGLSPLAPGQWKAYLLAYTALCVPRAWPDPTRRN